MGSWRAVTAAGLVCLLATAGCSGSGEPGPHSPKYVTLAREVSDGIPWQLDAWIDMQGHLCMSVDSQKGPDGLPVWVSACEFDAKLAGSDYYAGGGGPGGPDAVVNFGPLPANAMRVRVATGLVLTTRAIPRGSGLRPARFWLQYLPTGKLPATAGTPMGPVPLNASGHPIPFAAYS